MSDILVRMIALWSFSGPEGAIGPRPVGTILAGREFVTTQERANELVRKGKAKRLGFARVVPSQAPKPAPTHAPVAGPQETKISNKSVPQILAAVDAGEMDPKEALAEEEARGTPRVTLVEALKQRIDAGG